MADVAVATHAPAEHAGDDGHGHGVSTGISNTKLAMWLFLGSECLLFGGLISTYLLYKNRIAEGSIGPKDVFDIPFTSASSFVLLMSSLTMVLALSAIQRGDERSNQVWLLTSSGQPMARDARAAASSAAAVTSHSLAVMRRPVVPLAASDISQRIGAATGTQGLNQPDWLGGIALCLRKPCASRTQRKQHGKRH